MDSQFRSLAPSSDNRGSEAMTMTGSATARTAEIRHRRTPAKEFQIVYGVGIAMFLVLAVIATVAAHLQIAELYQVDLSSLLSP